LFIIFFRDEAHLVNGSNRRFLIMFFFFVFIYKKLKINYSFSFSGFKPPTGLPTVFDPSYKGVGLKVGLEIWRVEALKVIKKGPSDQAYQGKFHTGDSYIILVTKVFKILFTVTKTNSNFSDRLIIMLFFMTSTSGWELRPLRTRWVWLHTRLSSLTNPWETSLCNTVKFRYD
jgi:hypothetical protein